MHICTQLTICFITDNMVMADSSAVPGPGLPIGPWNSTASN